MKNEIRSSVSRKRACCLFILTISLLLAACGTNSNQTDGHNTANDSGLINTAYAQERENSENINNSRQNAITRAVAHVSPAVVGINVTQVQRYVRKSPLSMFFPELYRNRIYEHKIESLGSGFIISADGYIVTNGHVVENATEIVVTMTDGRRPKAKLIGADPSSDIALLKIEGDNYPFIEFGHSDDLIVGEWVIAIGNPFGLVELNNQPTVTVGVISAVDRDWGRTAEGALYLDMIQTDAAINHGNSGGPLVNSLGQVIGMNTFIFTGGQNQGSVGIGFAIPIDRINEIITEIREKGGINRDFWLGLDQVVSLNRSIIQALNLSVEKGALITDIEPGSPTDRSGLQEYDVIVAINGTPTNDRKQFIEALRNQDLKVGAVLTFTINRDGKQMDIDVTLEPNPRAR